MPRLPWHLYHLTLGLVFLVMIWICLIMLIGYGNLTSIFVKRTAKGVSALPYRFTSSFTGRGGILYIDVENGYIGFISAKDLEYGEKTENHGK